MKFERGKWAPLKILQRNWNNAWMLIIPMSVWNESDIYSNLYLGSNFNFGKPALVLLCSLTKMCEILSVILKIKFVKKTKNKSLYITLIGIIKSLYITLISIHYSSWYRIPGKH